MWHLVLTMSSSPMNWPGDRVLTRLQPGNMRSPVGKRNATSSIPGKSTKIRKRISAQAEPGQKAGGDFLNPATGQTVFRFMACSPRRRRAQIPEGWRHQFLRDGLPGDR